MHLALGQRGWLMAQWSAAEGGIDASPLQLAILDLELSAHQVPMITAGTTRLVVPAVVRWGHPGPPRPGALRGGPGDDPESASATPSPTPVPIWPPSTTKADRDGDEWRMNGQKMFTTGAQNCQFTFLLTNEPRCPQHLGLTMFLVPLHTSGVEISTHLHVGP